MYAGLRQQQHSAFAGVQEESKTGLPTACHAIPAMNAIAYVCVTQPRRLTAQGFQVCQAVPHWPTT